jgi:hypothetical protein
MRSAYRNIFIRSVIPIALLTGSRLFAQISPGELASVHAHLEGISNCTKCHTLGSKVTNDKCLECHTEIRTRISANKGFHVSPEVKGKGCMSCHSDHHGRNFEIVRFDKQKFDHTLTGYNLSGAHAAKTCADCHKPVNIVDESVKKKASTYLGLSRGNVYPVMRIITREHCRLVAVTVMAWNHSYRQ